MATALLPFVLRFIHGHSAGDEVPLTGGREYRIGSAPDCDLVLADDMVSPTHARLSTEGEGGRLELRDAGSASGTFVNGDRIERAQLKEGDRIMIGAAILKLTATARASLRYEDALERFNVDHPCEKSVFVMMKFPDSNASAMDSNIQLENAYGVIKNELQSYGLLARRADEEIYEEQLWDNICVYMLGCRFGIAVLLGNDLNPNVAIEYGYMKGLGREVLLLKDRSFQMINADLRGLIFAECDLAHPETVIGAITGWMKRLHHHHRAAGG